MNIKRYIMYKLAIGLVVCLLFGCTSQSNRVEDVDALFANADSVILKIVVPTFCGDTFNISNFGAREDADAQTNKAAINAAIDSANVNGGGVVFVPEGKWLTGPITLKSNVNLHVSSGSTLIFSTVYEDYLPAVLTRWEGVDCYNLHPLIYAYDQSNIAITGTGVIDGQGSEEFWWFMKGREIYGWREGLISQELGGRNRLLEYDQQQVDVENRVMNINDGLRPQLINVYKCKNVLIEGVTLRNSPFWVIHPLMVDGMTVRNVAIDSHGPNSDGCDPESSKNVVIENCFFDTGDDCIAIKSGRNYDGRRWNMPSENVIVRNCRMKNGHGGVVIGSEISGGFSNLWVENCKMDSPELERVIRIKTSNCRGGLIENIFVRNVEVGECQEAILKINLKYEPNEKCQRDFAPQVQNVNLFNVSSKKSQYGIYIVGLDESDHYVNGVTVSNCTFDGVAEENSISNATNVQIVNSTSNGVLMK